MNKSLTLLLFLLFTLLRAQDTPSDASDAPVVESDSGSENAVEEGATEAEAEAPEETATEGSEEAAESEETEVAEEGSGEEATEESSDVSLNNQINSTIQEIQSSLQGDGAEAEGVVMTEENVGSLVDNLWPSVQNFIEQSLAEVSTLDEMNVDEVTEEEAAFVRSKLNFYFLKT